MTRAVIYARYSSDKQTEQSIEGQLATCYEYAGRQGYIVTAEYIDRAMSAKTDNRPEFLRMVEDSKLHLFDVVIVYQLDRFSRNRYDSATYKAKLKKNGVRVLSARENISDDASGVLMEAVLEGMAEYFSAELSQKVRRGMDISAHKALSTGGRIPFGYKVGADKRYILDADKAPYALKIFEMYAAGRTVKDIADYLNERRVKTAAGGEFNKNSLWRMLTSKKYTGVFTYNGIEVPDGVPRIVSDELFQEVQIKMEKNKAAPARARATDEYLLTTKLYCGHCKSPMVGVSGKSSTGAKHGYYTDKGKCGKKNVRKDETENRVIELAREQLTDDNITRIAAAVAEECKKHRTDGDYKRLERERRENEKQTANIVEALKYGTAAATLLKTLAQLETDAEDIQRRLLVEKARNADLTEPDITFFLNRLREGDTEDLRYRRLLITVLVNAVYLYDSDDGGRKRITVVFNSSDKPVEITAELLDDIEKDIANVRFTDAEVHQ